MGGVLGVWPGGGVGEAPDGGLVGEAVDGLGVVVGVGVVVVAVVVVLGALASGVVESDGFVVDGVAGLVAGLGGLDVVTGVLVGGAAVGRIPGLWSVCGLLDGVVGLGVVTDGDELLGEGLGVSGLFAVLSALGGGVVDALALGG